MQKRMVNWTKRKWINKYNKKRMLVCVVLLLAATASVYSTVQYKEKRLNEEHFNNEKIKKTQNKKRIHRVKHAFSIQWDSRIENTAERI